MCPGREEKWKPKRRRNETRRETKHKAESTKYKQILQIKQRKFKGSSTYEEMRHGTASLAEQQLIFCTTAVTSTAAVHPFTNVHVLLYDVRENREDV